MKDLCKAPPPIVILSLLKRTKDLAFDAVNPGTKNANP